jgi:transcriptional regulator with XRE-family HTH domain
MSLFSDNIRYLRLQKNISQEKLAEELLITRARYVKYEAGTSEAPYDILKRISHYYHVSIDLLLSVDIRKVDMNGLIKLDDNRILLPITIDREGENIIEIIPHRAKAGYLTGYSDPEFIESLPQISLPFLGKGKFRALPIDGDSMPPHRNSSYIIGKYVEDREDIKNGKTYVFLTKSEGIVYKRVKKIEGDSLTLSSDNTFYDPYSIHLSEILEVWKYAGSIETEEFEADSYEPETIRGMFLTLQKGLKQLSERCPEKN